ncbi:MAG: NAD(P)/FAD-dependent oxidoreductase [Alphaproteobacteria bacterium]
MDADFLVIGGGIAGASAGWALAAHGRTVVLERESAPGYHTTGRSAAQYTELYGSVAIRALARLSKPFLEAPPQGFAEHSLLSPRGALFVGAGGDEAAIDALLGFADGRSGIVRDIGAAGACALVPALRPAVVKYALHEPASQDIDVHALHGGFLKGLRSRGGTLATDADATAIERRGGRWHVRCTAGEFAAPVLVNAAGAWADAVAAMAGVRPIGLVPKRRTAIRFAPEPVMDISGWPLTIDASETWYIKPDAGRLMGSPADETPSPPCDAQPEELDVAMAVDRIERATTLSIRRIEHRWAGLRSFAPDKTPVVGFAPDAEGFFWLAGQGGYGIKTSPAMAAATAALICKGELTSLYADEGLTAAMLAPDRFA